MPATKKQKKSSTTRPVSISAKEFALQRRFQEVAEKLAKSTTADLNVPLGHWAVAADRRLPFALLHRSIRQIINSRYEDLAATAGVGHKKLESLVLLLHRALQAKVNSKPEIAPPDAASVPLHSTTFQLGQVSQLMWLQWQETVRRHQLHDEMLGHLSPSLYELPTVIWKKKLGDYLDYTIEELRTLKTHGDKRISAVLEVFHLIHSALGDSPRSSRVAISLQPAFVPPIEAWMQTVLAREEAPSLDDIRHHLVLPVLNQIERDAGDVVHRLAAGRLGVEAFPESVRDQSLELGVTRARIYQLLETCIDVMTIRWPAGRWWLQLLAEKLREQDDDTEALTLVEALQWLLYPRSQRQMTVEPAIA